VRDTGVVQPGQDDGFVERCPRGAPHPVGPEFFANTEAGRGQLALDDSSSKADGRRWEVGVRNLGTQPLSYTVGVICLHATGRFVYPSVTGSVEAGRHDAVAIECPPRAAHALDGTMAAQSAAGLGQVVMSESVPETTRTYGQLRTWDVGIRNLSPTPQAYYAGVVCTSARLTTTTLFSNGLAVRAGSARGGSGRCPRHQPFPVAPIFYGVGSGGDGQFLLSDAFPKSRSFETEVTNQSATSQRAVIGGVCIGTSR
jgi:hypothetical protein